MTGYHRLRFTASRYEGSWSQQIWPLHWFPLRRLGRKATVVSGQTKLDTDIDATHGGLTSLRLVLPEEAVSDRMVLAASRVLELAL